MPYITVNVLKGRTVEEKRTLAKDITELIVKDLKLESKDVVTVQFVDVSPENLAMGGTLVLDR